MSNILFAYVFLKKIYKHTLSVEIFTLLVTLFLWLVLKILILYSY